MAGKGRQGEATIKYGFEASRMSEVGLWIDLSPEKRGQWDEWAFLGGEGGRRQWEGRKGRRAPAAPFFLSSRGGDQGCLPRVRRKDARATAD